MGRSRRAERPSPGYVVLCVVVFVLGVSIRACKHGLHRDIMQLLKKEADTSPRTEAVPIEQVETGDFVLARDPRTGRRIIARVSARTVRQVRQVRVLELQPLGGGSPVVIRTTDDHRFWVPVNATWAPAAQLKPGTLLGTGKRATYRVQVNRREEQGKAVRVYNLVVPGVHCYFLAVGGKPALLVHNLDCLPPPIDSKRLNAQRPPSSNLPSASFTSVPAAPLPQVPSPGVAGRVPAERAELPSRSELDGLVRQALDLVRSLSGTDRADP